MARQAKTNWMKCTVWTKTMRADIEGPTAACVTQAFAGIDDPKARELALERMAQTHQKMLASEAKGLSALAEAPAA